MFEGLCGRGFSPKCEGYIWKVKTRTEVQKRRKKVVVGYLKKDIADLLNNGLDSNAYARVEGLMNEINRASCYELIEKFCAFLESQLSFMQKQGDCPAESLESVASLIFAAARFADLPELCSLRRIFMAKYGNSLESFVNQEFIQKTTSKLPSVEEKVQLMQDIAQEFSVNWDSKYFFQKVSNPSAAPCVSTTGLSSWDNKLVSQDRSKPNGSFNDGAAAVIDQQGVSSSKMDPDRSRQYTKTQEEDYENTDHHNATYEDKNVAYERPNGGNWRSKIETRDEDSMDNHPTSPSKHRSECTKQGANHNSGYGRQLVRPPNDEEYEKDNLVNNAKPKPQSVRRRHGKTPPVDENHCINHQNVIEKEPAYVKAAPCNNNELVHPPDRTVSLFTETATEAEKGPARATSLQPDALSGTHVHPKLPDYNDLAARFAALKGSMYS